MEESVSGFKVRGDWGDVVEHGERITRALRESGREGPAFEEWNRWRPKAHERLSEDVNEKTAAQVSVDEGAGERAGKSAVDDTQEAGSDLAEAYAKLSEDDAEGAVEKWHESIDRVARAADTAGRKALRRVEDTVYRRVMTQFTPYYFDNDLVSANITKARDGDYIFEVNVNDDDLKSEAREHLSEFETDYERWHVDTEKSTATVAAAEGVEPPTAPEPTENDDPSPTRN
ncbi:MAG: DUF5828 family protein [Halobacteriaceae archaeon]